MDITKEALDLLVPVVVVKDSLKNGRFASSVEEFIPEHNKEVVWHG